MNYLHLYLIILLLSPSYHLLAQQLASNRQTNWHEQNLPAIRMDSSINILDFGGVGDGITINDSAWLAAKAAAANHSTSIYFPPGDYLFHQSLVLESEMELAGAGMNASSLIFDLGGSSNCIQAQGQIRPDSSRLILPANQGDSLVNLFSTQGFQVGDWVQIIQDDQALVTSNWAAGSVGQILKIKAIQNNSIIFHKTLRLSYGLANQAYIQAWAPKSEISIKCLKIKRLDATAGQTSNINFNYVVHASIHGVESEFCNFGHITLSHASAIHIDGGYFHEAFAYGGGGQGYGVVFQYTTGDCILENSIFHTLRHAILFQAGANGNVVSYNYSHSPFWSNTPSNSAGDIVLHGNYPYLNLIEGNICQNIIIDNSHGPNGPYNTFFRNRAELYGLIMSANNSPNQNFIANEISSSAFLQGNYILMGTGHYEYANNHAGNIVPNPNNLVNIPSYAYLQRPDFIPWSYWAKIGPPFSLEEHNNFAKYRWDNSILSEQICGNSSLNATASFMDSVMYLYEPLSDSSLFIPIEVQGLNLDSSSLTLNIRPNSTATIMDDFELNDSLLHWAPNADSSQLLELRLKADLISETTEFIDLELQNFNNFSPGTYNRLRIYIQDPSISKIEALQETVRLFPNPSNGIVQLEANMIEEIRVFNLLGQSIYYAQPYSDHYQLELHQSGTYWIHVFSENQKKQFKLIIY